MSRAERVFGTYDECLRRCPFTRFIRVFLSRFFRGEELTVRLGQRRLFRETTACWDAFRARTTEPVASSDARVLRSQAEQVDSRRDRPSLRRLEPQRRARESHCLLASSSIVFPVAKCPASSSIFCTGARGLQRCSVIHLWRASAHQRCS